MSVQSHIWWRSLLAHARTRWGTGPLWIHVMALSCGLLYWGVALSQHQVATRSGMSSPRRRAMAEVRTAGTILVCASGILLIGGALDRRWPISSRAAVRWRRSYGADIPLYCRQPRDQACLILVAAFYFLGVSWGAFRLMVAAAPTAAGPFSFAHRTLMAIVCLGGAGLTVRYWRVYRRRLSDVERYLDEGGTVCLRCGYILTGVRSNECPECGYPRPNDSPPTPASRIAQTRV